jgi:hypothetical protein
MEFSPHPPSLFFFSIPPDDHLGLCLSFVWNNKFHIHKKQQQIFLFCILRFYTSDRKRNCNGSIYRRCNHRDIGSVLTKWCLLFVCFLGVTTQCGCIFHIPVNGFSLLVFRGFLITHNGAPQSVGLLWTSDQSVAVTTTWQHSQQINIHAPGGIRTHNHSRRAAEDLRLRQRVHWDRHKKCILEVNSKKQIKYKIYVFYFRSQNCTSRHS